MPPVALGGEAKYEGTTWSWIATDEPVGRLPLMAIALSAVAEALAAVALTDAITRFCSTGLAGTEVLLAAAVLRAPKGAG